MSNFGFRLRIAPKEHHPEPPLTERTSTRTERMIDGVPTQKYSKDDCYQVQNSDWESILDLQEDIKKTAKELKSYHSPQKKDFQDELTKKQREIDQLKSKNQDLKSIIKQLCEEK